MFINTFLYKTDASFCKVQEKIQNLRRRWFFFWSNSRKKMTRFIITLLLLWGSGFVTYVLLHEFFSTHYILGSSIVLILVGITMKIHRRTIGRYRSSEDHEYRGFIEGNIMVTGILVLAICLLFMWIGWWTLLVIFILICLGHMLSGW
jgi:hypothetical protein